MEKEGVKPGATSAGRTRDRILDLLRRAPSTVNQLAGTLNLTDNAVRVHLAHLQSDELVETLGMVPGVRRPHVRYALTAAGERIFPKGYAPVLVKLMDALTDRFSGEQVEGVLRDVGRRLANGESRPAATSSEEVKQRAQVALTMLRGLGGLAELQDQDGQCVIQGFGCPLAMVTSKHPQACRLAEELLTSVLGTQVKENCEKGERPKCRFLVSEVLIEK